MQAPMNNQLLPALSLLLLAAATGVGGPADELDLLGPDYPRAFFFRSCESGPSRKGMTYEKWSAEYGRLSGMIGKCLDEEVVGREANNPAWFTRFKHEHPRQVVLLHFNGNARDPRHASAKYFPGHWIHRQAVRISSDVPATAEDTEIRVEDASDFRTGTGRYRTSSDDIALFGIAADGRHDWAHCEQVQLLAVDAKAGTIRVKRGCYGTKPLAFAAGQARAAAHQVEGPWGRNNHLLWYYNFTTHCPRDAEGKTCADRLVDDLDGWFGKGGKLESFDGLEFDVMFNETHGDTDGDGETDDGIIDGVNRYGIGMVEFVRQLRARLGDDRIIQGDGALGPGGRRSQRAFGLLNGIESEGWPNLNDWEFEDWSGGLNRHAFWQVNAHKPAFSYINHKWVEPVPGEPGEHANPDVPFSRHRLVFAAGQFTDAMITYAFTPPGRPGGQIGLWDELVGGTKGRTGWLGQPAGAAVHLAAAAPDTLHGIGTPAGDALAVRIQGPATARATADGIRIATVDAAAGETTFTVANVPVTGGDLVVFATMRGEPPAGYPRGTARFVEVVAGDAVQSLLQRRPAQTGMARRGQDERPIDPDTGARVVFAAGTTVAGTTRPAYVVHPPFRDAAGMVFWCEDVTVPPDAELRFHLGMGEKAPQRSDGVSFRVLAAPLAGTTAGGFVSLFEESTKAHAWLPRSVPLAAWAGRRIRLKFVADCGPRDNTTADLGYWGDVKIARAGLPEDQRTTPRRSMTWMGEQPFAACFHFRALQSTNVNLTFHVEGAEPVTLQRITAHAHPDAMYRLFENGLVLANPSRHPFTFDLAAIAPGNSYRRLQATPRQDTKVNNGQPVGKRVTLDPLDALFLQRAGAGGAGAPGATP